MLRVLFCFNCCSAPLSSRPARGKAAAVKSNEKLVEEANFKSLLTLNEKDQLLANQIHANNDNYGVKDSNTRQSGNILLLTPQSQQSPQLQTQLVHPFRSEDDSFLEASTSAKQDTGEHNAAYRAGESLALSYDDGSISPSSSIDIDSFRENPDDAQAAATATGEQPRTRSALIASADEDSDQNNLAPSSLQQQQATEHSGLDQASSVTTLISSSAVPQKIITSTTKIGDYARLEYSPVEDLESVTTYSQSRFGSEKGGQQVSGPNSTTTSRPSSFKNTSGNVSRRSSQGIESTSISIASQLSNEQLFQQNLTNMLETANSPIPLFGTIGLPLGPPLESYTTETAKTSPETTGAALTSASQDSLSSNSPDGSAPTNQAATLGSVSAGGALVNDSIEDSAEIAEMTRDPMDKTTRARLAQPERDIGSGERIESSLSMATTTSGGLTNPTPTPSEMSGTSQKKKSKLSAGKLFKRLKRGGSKKKSKENKVPK